MSPQPDVFILTYDDVPPSVNIGARRGLHWSVERKRKAEWEGIFAFLLLEQRVPKHMARAKASVLLEFVAPARRDSENYRSTFSKPFADALVNGGWLADDTDEFYELTKVVCSREWIKDARHGVKGRTTITLGADYDELGRT